MIVILRVHILKLEISEQSTKIMNEENLLVCTECGWLGVVRGSNHCSLCGAEQIEPFRAGWDESD